MPEPRVENKIGSSNENKTQTFLLVEGDPELALELTLSPDGLFKINNLEHKIHIIGQIDLQNQRVGINHLEVDEKLRGRGTGTRIMNVVEHYLGSRGIKEVFIAFRKLKILNFFLKRGYKIENPKKLNYTEMFSIGLWGILFDDGVIDMMTFDEWKANNPSLNTGGKIFLQKTLCERL